MNIEQVYRIVRRSIKEYGVVVVPLFSVLIYFWGYIFRYGFFDYYNISAEYIDVNLNEFILNCCYVFGLIIMIRLIIYVSNYNFLYIILLKIFNKRKDKGSKNKNYLCLKPIEYKDKVKDKDIINLKDSKPDETTTYVVNKSKVGVVYTISNSDDVKKSLKNDGFTISN